MGAVAFPRRKVALISHLPVWAGPARQLTRSYAIYPNGSEHKNIFRSKMSKNVNLHDQKEPRLSAALGEQPGTL